MEASRTPKRDPEAPAQVGIRELRHDFRAWITRARAGEQIVVTDRGMPVAALGPPPARTQLQRWIDSGEVVVVSGPLRVGYPADEPITTDGTDALQELREDRI